LSSFPNPLGGRKGPPADARPVYLDDGSGELVGYVAERPVSPGTIYNGGVNAFRGSRGVPFRCYVDFPSAEEALRSLRRRPPPDEDSMIRDDEAVAELTFRILTRGMDCLSRGEARVVNQMSTYEGEKELYFRAAHNLAVEIVLARRRKPSSAQWISRTKH
jgi:hypothetical protein